MRWIFVSLLASLLTPALAMAAPKDHLKINFIDTEGGQATLMVLPSGESMLVDAGWPGNNGRDAKRIVEAAKSYGLKKIDYVLVTHYHMDHVGGVPELAAAFPIGTVVDHGANNETDAGAQKLEAAYQKVIASGVKRLTVKPGDVLPIKGARIEIVAANGERIAKSVAGGGQPNPVCGSEPKRLIDTSENGRSVGFVLTFGKFRTVDLGDLTWNKELDLSCPDHAIGPVDLFIVSHHGWQESNSKALVYGLKPRVAVMDNGAKKGGSPAVWRTVTSSPGIEDLWQLHYSVEGGDKANVPAERIANTDEHCQGAGIEADVAPSGAFSVKNLRTGFTKEYAAR
jgi:beta-lactamase superfamily II metal-dependent hydrolase